MLGRFSGWARLRDDIIGLRAQIHGCGVRSINVLFKIFLELWIFFIGAGPWNLLLDTLRDQIRDFELTLLLLSLLHSLDNGRPRVFRNLILHSFEFFFRVSFNLLNLLIFPFDFVFVFRESLPPSVFQEFDELILLFLFLLCWIFILGLFGTEGHVISYGQPCKCSHSSGKLHDQQY